MKTVLKNIVGRTYRPLLVRYLSRTRAYHFEDIRLVVPPPVFHPGFFFSTHFLLQFIQQFPLRGKRFLEPGAGSGLISIYAAKKGAAVTATDINPVAVEWLHRNGRSNRVDLEVIQSDLFDQVKEKTFDLIAINPPYYKRNPRTHADYAWYCGVNGEYFLKLFRQLPAFIHEQTGIFMVLCEGCDIGMIESAAAMNGFQLDLLRLRKGLLENDFIYRIRRKN